MNRATQRLAPSARRLGVALACALLPSGAAAADADADAAVELDRIEVVGSRIRRANCVADGMPGGSCDPAAGAFRMLTGGNLGRRPEEAVSHGVGVAWRPSALPGFDASLDGYRIEVDDAIAEPGGVGRPAGTRPGAAGWWRACTTSSTAIRP